MSLAERARNLRLKFSAYVETGVIMDAATVQSTILTLVAIELEAANLDLLAAHAVLHQFANQQQPEQPKPDNIVPFRPKN